MILLAQLFWSRPQKQVATLNSLHLVSTSTFCHNRSFLVLSMFLVATLEARRNLFVTLLTLCLCLSYIYLVATPIISVVTFYLHQYRIFSRDRKTGSRPQLILLAFLLVATPIFLLQSFSLLQPLFQVATTKWCRDLMVALFLVGFCSSCLNSCNLNE